MTTNAPDLMSLLCLDPKLSQSTFGGQHRTLLIQKDFSNSGDFVFNNLLHHFGRREPNTQILLITLAHDWVHYSTCAAKCGFNLRKKQNMGNIEVFSIMERSLDDMCLGASTDYCDLILTAVREFISLSQPPTISDSSQQRPDAKPTVILFDDLSLLLTLGARHSDIYRLVTKIDSMMRQRSAQLPAGRLNHLVVQTLFTKVKTKQAHIPADNDLNFLVASLNNMCDMSITLRPLETGHSTRVDGTIRIHDNRLPVSSKAGDAANKSVATPPPILSMFSVGSAAGIGSKRAYFFKLSDRRVRLTTNALIF